MNRPTLFNYPHSEYTYEECKDKYLDRLEQYCETLEKALNFACNEWEDEVTNCMLLKSKYKCNQKCEDCTFIDRVEYRKKYCLEEVMK